jgi:hypothetical protein
MIIFCWLSLAQVMFSIYSIAQLNPPKKIRYVPLPFVAAEGQQQIEAQVHEDLYRDPGSEGSVDRCFSMKRLPNLVMTNSSPWKMPWP